MPANIHCQKEGWKAQNTEAEKDINNTGEQSMHTDANEDNHASV